MEEQRNGTYEPKPDPNGFELQDDGAVTSATPAAQREDDLRQFLRARISGISTAAEDDIVGTIFKQRHQAQQELLESEVSKRVTEELARLANEPKAHKSTVKTSSEYRAEYSAGWKKGYQAGFTKVKRDSIKERSETKGEK